MYRVLTSEYYTNGIEAISRLTEQAFDKHHFNIVKIYPIDHSLRKCSL